MATIAATRLARRLNYSVISKVCTEFVKAANDTERRVNQKEKEILLVTASNLREIINWSNEK